jgi:hypothetical protein
MSERVVESALAKDRSGFCARSVRVMWTSLVTPRVLAAANMPYARTCGRVSFSAVVRNLPWVGPRFRSEVMCVRCSLRFAACVAARFSP